MTPQANKIVPVAELVGLIDDGQSIALGGSFLHRGPFAVVRELVRQGRTGIEVVKQSPGYDLDLLCRAGVADRAKAGIVALEGNFGLAPWYRRAVETGALALEEHACATLTAGLRAAAFGVPFQPVAGVHGSDLIKLNAWVDIPDPYGSDRSAIVIPAITPDVAVIHANEITSGGDTRVFGTTHWDHVMSRAAKTVVVVAERVVDADEFRARPELTLLPGFMVTAAAVVPHGAWPGSCWPDYGIDYEAITDYLDEHHHMLDEHLARGPETRVLEVAR